MLTLSPKLSPFPYAVVAVAAYTQKSTVTYDEYVSGIVLALEGSELIVEEDAVKALAKVAGLAEDSDKVIYLLRCISDSHTRRQSSSFFSLAKKLAIATTLPEIVSSLDSLDDHLAYRTFLVGHGITAVDWSVWGALKGAFDIRSVRLNESDDFVRQYQNRRPLAE